MKLNITQKLVLIFFIALISLFLIEFIFTTKKERKEISQMKEAVALTKYWFNCVEKMKYENNLLSRPNLDLRYNALIGDEFTKITTTLGSLEAKNISTNPEFAALIVKYLTDCNIDSTKCVGVILSGSFPALGISCLAALQTINAKAIIFSSLGASMFGANQPGATWLDIENYLYKNGRLNYHSFLVTPGGENDNGGGLSEEGFQMLIETALHYNIDLYLPNGLKESIEIKSNILLRNNVDLLINIGGNQSSLGRCVHSINIPNGLNKDFVGCSDTDKGILADFSGKGIPFVNLLYIKNLAIENGISLSSSGNVVGSIYWERDVSKVPVVSSLMVLSLLIILSRKKHS